jgi:DNA-binding transcriptional MerR regulator
MSNDDLLLCSQAARILGRSTSAVRYYEATGVLPVMKTTAGVRLFRRGDVQKLALKLRAKGAEPDQRQ